MKQRIKGVVPYLLVVLAIVLPWFFKRGYLFFTDWIVGPNIRLDWRQNQFLADVILKYFGMLISPDLTQKIFISLVLLVVMLGAKKIVEYFISDKWLVFILSLFALFNPFVYDRLAYGQWNIVLSLGLLCWAVGFLLKYRDGKKRKDLLCAAVSLGFMVQASPHFIFFGGVFYLLFFVVALAGNYKKNERGVFLRKEIMDAAIVGAAIIILNINWFIAMFGGSSQIIGTVSSGISAQDLAAFQTAGQTGVKALGNILMMSGFWGKDQYRYIDLMASKENWGRSFFILLPFILWGIASGLRFRGLKKIKDGENEERSPKRFTIGFLVVFAVAVLLAVGIRILVAKQITYWLYDHFPFYKGLRETQKWVSVIVVAYLVFLSLGIKELFKKKWAGENSFIIKMILAAVIIMQAPFMLWGMRGQIRSTEYPKDWYEANELIRSESYKAESKSCDGNVLFLPWHQYMGFRWIGGIAANPAPRFFDCPVISGTNMEWGGIYDNSQNKNGFLVGEWLSSRGQTDLLKDKDLNIKYIILAKEVDWKRYLLLEKFPGVNIISETETLKVYSVTP